jgi:hypothetical protein
MKITLFHFDTTAMWSATAGPLLEIARAKAAKKATEKTVAKASAIFMATFPGGCPIQISATGNVMIVSARETIITAPRIVSTFWRDINWVAMG